MKIKRDIGKGARSIAVKMLSSRHRVAASRCLMVRVVGLFLIVFCWINFFASSSNAQYDSTTGQKLAAGNADTKVKNSQSASSETAGSGTTGTTTEAASGAGTSAAGASGDTTPDAPAATGTPGTTGDAPSTTDALQGLPGDASGSQPNGTVPGMLKSMPVPADANAHKVPLGNGKPQIGLQMPPAKQLAFMLRITEPAARVRIKSAEAKARNHIAVAGMDPGIDIDDAMALGKPVINIYLKKSVGDNIVAHPFALQAYLCQYQRKPSGRIDLVRFARIGESDQLYSGADFEDKVTGLVDAYLSARHHQIKEAAAAAAKKSKPAAKGKKTK